MVMTFLALSGRFDKVDAASPSVSSAELIRLLLVLQVLYYTDTLILFIMPGLSVSKLISSSTMV